MQRQNRKKERRLQSSFLFLYYATKNDYFYKIYKYNSTYDKLYLCKNNIKILNTID